MARQGSRRRYGDATADKLAARTQQRATVGFRFAERDTLWRIDTAEKLRRFDPAWKLKSRNSRGGDEARRASRLRKLISRTFTRGSRAKIAGYPTEYRSQVASINHGFVLLSPPLRRSPRTDGESIQTRRVIPEPRSPEQRAAVYCNSFVQLVRKCSGYYDYYSLVSRLLRAKALPPDRLSLAHVKSDELR